MRLLSAVMVLAVSVAAHEVAAQCSAKTITCGTAYTDSLSPSGSCIIDSFPTQRYVFTGSAGQRLTLIATNSQGNLIGMQLTNSAGLLLNSAFDEPAQIEETLPVAGQYFVEVNFGNPHVSGAIRLEVSCSQGTTPTPGTCTHSGTVLIGQSISAQLSSADTPCGSSTSYAKAYRIPVTDGGAFTIDYSANYPVGLQLASPGGSGIYKEVTTNALTTAYVASVTGNVTLYVYSNASSPRTGTFTLTLTPLTLPPCGRVRAVKH